MKAPDRQPLLLALRTLLDSLGVRPEELQSTPRSGPLRGPKGPPRGLANIRRGAATTAKVQAQARGHDISRFYALGEGRSRATCYTCDREAIIIIGPAGDLTTTGGALKEPCG